MGDLLLVGGEVYNAASESIELSNKILKVDLDTGDVYLTTDMPDGAELARTAVSGGKLAIAAVYTQSGKPFFDITDLNTFESHNLPKLEAKQQMEMALGSTSDGFILAGLVSRDGGIWQDNWYFNFADSSFSDIGKILSLSKTFQNVGITVGNAFYVWGQSSQTADASFFRKTNVPANYVLTPSVNNADMGTISPEKPVTVADGKTQTFTAAAKAGYHIDYWLVNGEKLPAAQSIDVIADGDKTVEAVYTKENRQVTAIPIIIDTWAGQPIAKQLTTVTLSADRFVNLYVGQDISFMFASKPEGLTFTVVSAYDIVGPEAKLLTNAANSAKSSDNLSGNTLKVAISGTPADIGTFDLTMTIPGEYLESGIAITGANSGEMTINEVNPLDKPADYSKVDAAIEKAKALNVDDYVNFDAVTKAINAVDRNKKISEQKAVDNYALAIENAINGLVKKPTTSPTTTSPTAASQSTASQDTASPQTGDNSNMAICFALLFVSGGAVAVLGVAKKRKRY